jgi:exosome complex RNA-binding protein Rrp4
MVIAVDNSSASRKAMSHGMAMANMLKSPPEVKIVYAIGLNPEQTKPIQFL